MAGPLELRGAGRGALAVSELRLAPVLVSDSFCSRLLNILAFLLGG
jgi:hypothetical protein